MKHINLHCDRHHCGTDFSVKINNEEDVRGYYICPICEGLVWVDKEDITEDIRTLKVDALIDGKGIHIQYTAEDGLSYDLKYLEDSFFINILKEKGYKVIKS